ncbi:MAG: IS21 family transposase [Gemmatimonadetes bacterium]|nr:IS21 family transposase [Gemmatimonadota bacterium]
MFGREKRVLARHYLDEGMSRAEVARRVGIGRRTLYNWIADGLLEGLLGDQKGGYGPRRPRASKLDPYKGIIEARLARYPELSAARLFEEVRAAGYRGGYDQVRRHVREVRPQEPTEPPVRFETPPGHQGQVDFAEFPLPWGRRHALMVVLGYSRRLWLRFYERQTMGVVIRGLEESFAFFGGVPAEMLFDQMKAVVLADGRGSGGRLVENPEFRGFSDHWGFRIRACRPYRAQTKGKVERPVRYLRRNFFYGWDFVSDDDLNARARRWLDEVANVRVHGTLGERIDDRFARERPLLGPLAPHPYRPVVPRPVPSQTLARAGRATPRVEVERRPLGDYALFAERSP